MQPTTVGGSNALLLLGLAWRRNRMKLASIGVALIALVVGGFMAIASLNRAVKSERDRIDLVAESSGLAIDQGLYHQTIAACDAAIAGGHADPASLHLRKLDAYIALNDAKGVLRELERLESMPDAAPEIRGQVMLWKGDLGIDTGEESVTHAKTVRRALEIGLPPARHAYAQALLAESSTEAVTYLESALGHDRYFVRARKLVAVLHACLGRGDEARRHLALLRYSTPKDPGGAAVLALLGALEGDKATLDRATADLKSAGERGAQAESILRFVFMVAEMFRSEALISNSSPANILPILFAAGRLATSLQAEQSPQSSIEGRLLLPYPPTLQRFGREFFASLKELIQGVQASSVERWQRLAAMHPVTELHLLAALGQFRTNSKAGYTDFVKALSAPSAMNIPRGPIHALAAAAAYANWNADHTQEIWSDRALEQVRGGVRHGDLNPYQTTVLSGIAYRCDDLSLAWSTMSLVPEAEGEKMELYARIRANLALRFGRPAEALTWIEKAIQLAGEPTAKHEAVRTKAVAILKEVLKDRP